LASPPYSPEDDDAPERIVTPGEGWEDVGLVATASDEKEEIQSSEEVVMVSNPLMSEQERTSEDELDKEKSVVSEHRVHPSVWAVPLHTD
jgi:hypothetical protein